MEPNRKTLRSHWPCCAGNYDQTSAGHINVGNLPNPNVGIDWIEVIHILLIQVPAISETEAKPATRINLDTAEHIDRQVQARVARRDILHRIDDPPHLWAIVDESALRRPIGGPEVMRSQLSYLLRVGQHPNIDIQVMPYTAGAHPSLGVPFTILTFPEQDPTIVYTDSIGTGQFEEDPEAVHAYSQAFAHLQTAASTTVESAHLIEGIREEIE